MQPKHFFNVTSACNPSTSLMSLLQATPGFTFLLFSIDTCQEGVIIRLLHFEKEGLQQGVGEPRMLKKKEKKENKCLDGALLIVIKLHIITCILDT